jgi:hypothetical protein
MTRRDEGHIPGDPGGHAAERRRQFEQERGLSGRPQELNLDQEGATDEDTDIPTPSKEEEEPPTGQDD